MDKLWKSFRCLPTELNLNIVLACGQTFRWTKNKEEEWVGVAGKKVWILRQEGDSILYKSITSENSADVKIKIESEQEGNEKEESFLKDYFQLKISLENLYKQWNSTDTNFNSLSNSFDGVRMLRQDPVENLFSFICSQNNHITRISSMVEKLCTYFGDEICEIEGKQYHAFPNLVALSADDVEGKLRELGFGYRAKYIHQCAKQILEKHSLNWLYELRSISYKEAHKALCGLPGVGAKVADCVCLMSLDKPDAIPVDTHMWQIAQRDYLPHLKKYKTLTDKIYQEIGDHFRSIYGEYAGWAHSVLFSADLKRFRDLKDSAQKSISKKKDIAEQNEEKPKIEEMDVSLPSPKSKKPTKRETKTVLKRRSSRTAAGEKGAKLRR